MKNNKLFIICAVLIVLICIVLSTFATKEKETKKVKEDLLGINYNVEKNEASLDQYDTTNPVVALYVEDYGSIVMELYPDVAPNTVNNFISLTKVGYYDNNTMHRLVPHFVLQGGDPTGTGTGGPGYSIKGEFKENGFGDDVALPHDEMVVSMARSQDNDSAGGQFFIMLEKNTYLDGKYAAFGKVIDGWDNIKNIASSEKIADENSGQLQEALTIKKALVDCKGKSYPEPEKIMEEE